MLTSSTITDEQIEALRAKAIADKEWDVVHTCNSALTHEHIAGSLDMAFAMWVVNDDQMPGRARCAEIINARVRASTESEKS